MNDYTIRLMRPDERTQVHDLMKASFEAYLRPIFFIHEDTTLVVIHEENVVAGINLDIYPIRKGSIRMGYIGWLYTDKAHQGKGLASKLFDAAITFLIEQGCTDVAGCVEGDNPSSFKQFAHRDFSIMSFSSQVKRFGIGFLKIWKHASRFLDMGYFFWHKQLKEDIKSSQSLNPSKTTQMKDMGITFGLCCLMWCLALVRTNVALFCQPSIIGVVLFPLLLLSVRTLAMWVTARINKLEVMFLPWDTAWTAGILLPLLFGWPFPIPGNLYVKGMQWSLKYDSRAIARMAISGVVGTMLVILLLLLCPRTEMIALMLRYAKVLLFVDTCCFFYPFCGFNGSRIKRESVLTWIILSIGTIVLLFL